MKYPRKDNRRKTRQLLIANLRTSLQEYYNFARFYIKRHYLRGHKSNEMVAMSQARMIFQLNEPQGALVPQALSGRNDRPR